MATVVTGLLLCGTLVRAGDLAAQEPPPAPTLSVGIVGDSIAHEARASVTEIVGAERPIAFQLTQNAAELDTISESTIEAVTAPEGPDILVLVIGTAQVNLPFYPYRSTPPVVREWAAQLDDLLASVGSHVECVRVFDVQERPTHFYLGVDRYAPALNAATRSVVAGHPNADYFHYAAWAQRAGRPYDWGDGLHHNLAGQQAVARMIADAADSCDPATVGTPFWDIPADHWASDAVAWMAAEGLASGYDNGSFRSEVDRLPIEITRAQIVSMLWNQAGRPVASAGHDWSDGRPWVNPALDWAAEWDLLTGWPDGTFRPDQPITRAQVARLVWRLSGEPTATTAHPWSDGAAWVQPALDWLGESDLMTGWPDGTFRPGLQIGRGAVARLLFRWSA